MAKFSQKLLSACFPDAASVEANIAEGIRIGKKKGEAGTVQSLELCQEWLQKGNCELAVIHAQAAGYSLMAAAIEKIFQDGLDGGRNSL